MTHSLAYRIDPSAKLSAEIGRIVREQASAAADRLLRSADEEERETVVHDARKHLKKARGALRLAAPLFVDDELRSCVIPIRDAGRSLSGQRDADVLVQALASIRQAHPEETESEFVDQIQLELEQRRNAAAGERDSIAAAEAVSRHVAIALDRLHRWQPEPVAAVDAIERGVTASLRRSARAHRRLSKEADSPDVWHVWRQALKDVWYHARLLQSAWPPVMRGLSQGLRQTGARLGEAQNLSVLISALETGRGTDWNTYGVDAVTGLARTDRTQLWSAALSDGARLHAEKPRGFARRVARSWERSVAEASAGEHPSDTA